jgi:predicted ATPase
VEILIISGNFVQKIGGLMEETNKIMYSDGEILKVVKKVKGIIIANLGKTKDNPTTFQWTPLVKKNWNTYIQATWLN